MLLLYPSTTNLFILMLDMALVRSTAIGSFFIALLLLTGCRTYGGYGTEEATLQQMAVAVDNYAADLNRARTNLAALQRAAEGNTELALFAQQYEALATGHAVLLREHREYLAELQDSDDYRRLSRVFGAMVSEQNLTRRQYQELLYMATHAADSTALVPSNVQPLGRYYIIPPFYARVVNARLASNARFEIGADQGPIASPPDTTQASTLQPEATPSDTTAQ